MSREDRRIERAIDRGMRRGNRPDSVNDDDLIDSLVWIGIAVVVGLAAITAGLGWLDAEFGWGLKAAFMSWLNGLFHK